MELFASLIVLPPFLIIIINIINFDKDDESFSKNHKLQNENKNAFTVVVKKKVKLNK